MDVPTGDTHPVPIDVAIARRVRELREAAGASRETLARAAQRAGMRWTVERIAHMEAGRSLAPTLSNLLALAAALTDAAGYPVGLVDLLPDSGVLEVSPGRRFTAEGLRDALAGGPVPPLQAPLSGTIADPRLEPGWGLVDDRLVSEFGLDPYVVRAATRELYGQTATQERDARAGEGATPQQRGGATPRIMREVVAAARSARKVAHV